MLLLLLMLRVTSIAVLYSALYLCVHSPNCACMPPSLASSHADLCPANLVTTVTITTNYRAVNEPSRSFTIYIQFPEKASIFHIKITYQHFYYFLCVKKLC